MVYNTIYEKLTADPNDLVGAFAYIIYKQQKVDYFKSFGGRELRREEVESFHAIAALDTSIAAYRTQGEALAQTFLNASLDELVERTEAATRKDTLHRQIDTVHAGLAARLAAISESLNARRTLSGWACDVAGNLLVNLVSIFVLGALLLGYRFCGELQQSAEKKVGVNAPGVDQGSQGRAVAPGGAAKSVNTGAAPAEDR